MSISQVSTHPILNVSLIFILGPSGVGKSTLLRRVAEKLPSVKTVELDQEVKRRFPVLFQPGGLEWNRFWDASVTCIESLTQDARSVTLIDVGAGSLQTPAAIDFFRSADSVFIKDTPNNTLRKNQGRLGSHWTGRSLADFEVCEFSKLRQTIYATAQHVVDVGGRSEDQSLEDLIRELKLSPDETPP